MEPLVDIVIEDDRWEAFGLEALATTAVRAGFAELGLAEPGFTLCLMGCDDARILELNGDFRGKALIAPEGQATRPTSDRARQAIFNILDHAPWAEGLDGLRVIDLFAGGGGASTGIELALGFPPHIAVNHDPEAVALVTQIAMEYRQEFKKDPKEIRFREIKGAKNKDGSSQQNVITLNYQSEDFQLQKSFFWYQLLGMCKMIENADSDTYMVYNTFDMLGGREAFQQLVETQFGYKQDKTQSDLVRTEKGAIKDTQYIEQRTPDSVE